MNILDVVSGILSGVNVVSTSSLNIYLGWMWYLERRNTSKIHHTKKLELKNNLSAKKKTIFYARSTYHS